MGFSWKLRIEDVSIIECAWSSGQEAKQATAWGYQVGCDLSCNVMWVHALAVPSAMP